MYVNSEEEDDLGQFNFDRRSSDKKYQKQVPKHLVATSSPLRVKQRFEDGKQSNQVDKTKFYSADSSDMEKVVVCSVITSGRPEGEDSLSNT